MSKTEIIVLIIIGGIALSILALYAYHSIKMKPKKAKEDKPKDEEQASKNSSITEQKPVAVGIIKEEKPEINADTSIEEYDLAPFKEHNDSKQEEIKKEVNSLSPEMKKVLMSDLLKPKF